MKNRMLAEDAIQHGVTNDDAFETMAATIHGFGHGLTATEDYEPAYGRSSEERARILEQWKADEREVVRAEMVRQGVSSVEHIITSNDGAHDDICRMIDRGVPLWEALDRVALPSAEAMGDDGRRPPDSYLGAPVKALMERHVDHHGSSSKGRSRPRPTGGDTPTQLFYQLCSR